MKNYMLLIVVFSFVFLLMGCNQSTTEKIETEYYGLKPNTLSEKALDEKVLAAYKVFEEKYFKSVPGKDQMYLDYIYDEREDPEATWVKRNAITVSEAHGYAMVILTNIANMDLENSKAYEEKFIKFYNFYKAHPSQYTESFMCWQILGRGINMANGSGELTEAYSHPTSNSSATDGDMDIAYSLLIADNLWGSDGVVDYRKEALTIIDDLYKTCVHPEEYTLLLGDWVKNHSSDYNMKLTRSSDFMMNHLKTFATVDEKNREGWEKVLKKTEEITLEHVEKTSGNTGLLPDFFVKENDKYIPSPGYALESEFDGDYNWNACRTSWRITRDYLTTGDETFLKTAHLIDKFIKDAANEEATGIAPGYYITKDTPGKPLPDRDYFSTSFIAPFMVTAAANPESQEWLNELWRFLSEEYPVLEDTYFGNAIRMHAYLIVSGNMINPK